MSAGQDWDNVPGFDPKKEEYVPLDLDDWLARHRVVAEGEKLGRANKPSAADRGLDATESDIKDWINRRGLICRQNVGNHLSDLQRELADLDSQEDLAILEQQVAQQVGDAETALGNAVRNIRNDLTDKEDDVRIGHRELERFRRENKLTRLPDYSHRRSALWAIGICALIEIVLNASLLMEVNAFGLVGSVMQMSLISAVNVIFAGLAAGVLLRQCHHVSVSRKAIAGIGLAVVLALVFLFNLGVGHFRDSMEAILQDPFADPLALGGDTVERMFSDPFGLGSFQTILLVLLGVLCFGFSAWKWLQRDDSYPHYGRRDRELEGKKAAYRKAYESADEALRDTYQEHQSKLEDKLHGLQVKQSKWKEVSGRGNALVADYPLYMGQYQNDLDRLLAAYRSANKNARSEPPPAHFDDQVPIDEAILQPPAFDPPAATSLKGVGDRVHGAITKLQEAYRAATANIPTLETVAKRGIEEFRADAAG